MSTRIKLYYTDPTTHKLYMCRFSHTLDVDKAHRLGWNNRKLTQKQFKVDIRDICIEIPQGKLKESDHDTK